MADNREEVRERNRLALAERFTASKLANMLFSTSVDPHWFLSGALASLITFREYTAHNPHCAGKYLAEFSAFNFGFLGVMLAVCSLL